MPTTTMTSRWPTRALDAEQEGDEATGPRHLGEQVEERDDERRDGRGDADRALAQPEAEHVGHRVLADVAEQLGDEQQGDEPGDEEADGVEEPVVAVDGDGAGDAEERGRRQVVTGDGDAVLPAGEGASAGVVLGGAAVVARRPDDDREGDDDEEGEDADVDRRVADRRRSGRPRDGRGAGEERAHCCPPIFSGEGFGLGVEDAVGPAGVDHRDGEGRDELEEPEDQAPRDVADDPRPHEVLGEDGQQDVEEVPREEQRGQREHEPAELAAQLVELGRVLHGDVGIVDHALWSLFAHWATSGAVGSCLVLVDRRGALSPTPPPRW